MLRFDDARKTLDLGVHDLLEASAPRGDLRISLAWSATTRMRAGQRAHVAWQQRQGEVVAGYASEVTVRLKLMVEGWEVTLSGRLDGLYEEGEVLVVEELKTTALPEDRLSRLSAEDFPDWHEQVQLYLWLLLAQDRPAVGRLVLSSILDGSLRVLHVEPRDGTHDEVMARLRWILAQREARLAWSAERRQHAVPFAHPSFREGQEALSNEIFSALQGGRHLLLCAPTGLGKTASALWAALEAARRADARVFFATARGTQQRLAEETVAAMIARGLRVRAVSLRARERSCLNEAVICRADACRFAAGYHDRLRAAGLPEAAWTGPHWGGDAIVELGRQNTCCPHALSMDLGAGADLVIGDYNYLFDPGVRPTRLFEEGLGGWIAVVDEAHNLPDRAMGYQSPALSCALAEAASAVHADDPEAEPFRAIAREIHAWLSEGWARAGGEDPAGWGGEEGAAWGEGELSLPISRDLIAAARDLAESAEALALPWALYRLRVAPGEDQDPWQELVRGLLRMRSALERAGDETVAIWARPGLAQGGLRLLCRDPSPVLGPLFMSLQSSVCLSATLEPARYYQDMLGLEPGRVHNIRAESPFPPENRRVLIVPGVTTAFKHRTRDREATAALISEALAAIPGNAAVFFSSFSHRDDLAPLLTLDGRPVLSQARAMSEAERKETLDALQEGGRHVLLGVLGGVFSEGVDLPGDRLLGAVIVGLGLPALSLERKLLERWFEDRYGEGHRYAWLVPGLARVVQAAGRVIRTPEDRGVIVLIDRRFLQYEIQSFFPPEWTPERVSRPGTALDGFWDRGASKV